MRYLFGFMCVCAIGVMPLVGCSETTGDGGNGGTAGDGGSGGTVVLCENNVCECSEAGIRAAIEAAGDEPYTFDCVGAQTVVTEAEIVIDNDVIVDAEGKLTVDGNGNHVVFSVPEGVTAELRGFTVTGGGGAFVAGGISNSGDLLLTSSTVSGNTADQAGGGIYNSGTLTLTNSTVSGNEAIACGNIANIDLGIMTLTNSTVSSPGDICNEGNLMLFIHSTVWNPGDTSVFTGVNSTTTLENTVVDGECLSDGDVVSNGYNLESPGDTCGFDQTGDQVSVPDPMLGPLQNNGGPTETHALLSGSPAINQIPVEDCLDADGAPLETDQRGKPRPETGGTLCDVGAFERQTDEP